MHRHITATLVMGLGAGLATFAAWGVDLLVERYHKLQDAQDAAEHADE